MAKLHPKHAPWTSDLARPPGELEPSPSTEGEEDPAGSAELAHALQALERTGGLENAEWNHLDEGGAGWPLEQLDDGRPPAWPPV